MAPTHDPISPSQALLLNQELLEGTTKELGANGSFADLNFLLTLGYFKLEQTHISADPEKHRWRFTRTQKPYRPGE